jgi:hypothetical protein
MARGSRPSSGTSRYARDPSPTRPRLGAGTIKDFGINGSDPKQGTVQKWQRALEAAGVRFIDADDQDGLGVRLRGTKGKR